MCLGSEVVSEGAGHLINRSQVGLPAATLPCSIPAECQVSECPQTRAVSDD